MHAAEQVTDPQILYFMSVSCLCKVLLPQWVVLIFFAPQLAPAWHPASLALISTHLLSRFLCQSVFPGMLEEPPRPAPHVGSTLAWPSQHTFYLAGSVPRSTWACKEKDPLSGRCLILCELNKVLFHFLERKCSVAWHILERCDFCSSFPQLFFRASPNLIF